MRRSFAISIGIAIWLAVGSLPASAATNLGQTVGTMNCSSPQTVFQVAFPGVQYVVPTDGVITSWSYLAPSNAQIKPLEFKVARRVGDSNDLTIIGESPRVTPAEFQVNTFLVKIPVKAGDLIGLYLPEGGHCGVSGGDGAEVLRTVTPDDRAVGNTTTYAGATNVQLDVAASLEPDCDKDGNGDETQDSDIDTCKPPTGTCKGIKATVKPAPEGQVTFGTSGRDVIVGTAGRDVIRSGGGNDLICARAGNDTVVTGGGKDRAFGQGGPDRLGGGAGSDKLVGGNGADRLTGAAGADVLRGAAGSDALFGGPGTDTLRGGPGPDRLLGGPALDRLFGGPGRNRIAE